MEYSAGWQRLSVRQARLVLAIKRIYGIEKLQPKDRTSPTQKDRRPKQDRVSSIDYIETRRINRLAGSAEARVEPQPGQYNPVAS